MQSIELIILVESMRIREQSARALLDGGTCDADIVLGSHARNGLHLAHNFLHREKAFEHHEKVEGLFGAGLSTNRERKKKKKKMN
jgi:hypothetical protein